MTVGTSASDQIAPQVLREYALLADGERGAVVGPGGDIVWLCAPRWTVTLCSPHSSVAPAGTRSPPPGATCGAVTTPGSSSDQHALARSAGVSGTPDTPAGRVMIRS
jgi:hypothetical protein